MEKARILMEALPFIKEYYGHTVVIKFGGNAMVDEELKESFASDIVLMRYVGINPIIVHGGGPQITEYMERLSLDVKFVNGHRVTDASAMEVVKMVLVGKVNKEIVSLINGHGDLSVGLSGEDGRMLLARKKLQDGADLGFVGEVEKVNPQILLNLARDGFIPVVASVGVDEAGQSYNINADHVAGALAVALEADKLIYLTDVNGIYRDHGRSRLAHIRDEPGPGPGADAQRHPHQRDDPQAGILRGGPGSGGQAGAHHQRDRQARPAPGDIHSRGSRHHADGIEGNRKEEEMGLKELQEKEKANIMQTYARKPVLFVRGAGTHLWDDQGREYLDFVSGLGACVTGHAHPEVAAAVAHQAARLIQVSNLYYTQPQVELAEALTSLTFADKVFFCNSGTEACEGAIKLVRKYMRENGRDERYGIITALRSFHGRTYGRADRHRTAGEGAALRAAGAGVLPRSLQRPRRPSARRWRNTPAR